MFVMVARQMNLPGSKKAAFPNTDGSDITREFESERKRHMSNALQEMIDHLEKKRTTEETSSKVRPSSKAPRSMAKAGTRPDAKE